jgi:hypothetical protein
MLCAGWLKSLGFSPINLLKLMDAGNNETVCELAIRAILAAPKTGALKKLSAAQKKAYDAAVSKPVELGDLAVESALLLRVKCEAIKEDDKLSESARAEQLENLIPDTPVICEAIQKHLGLHVASVRDANSSSSEEAGDSDDSFTVLQLLKLARLADFSDEAGRNQCLALLHNMLCSAITPDELVEACLRALGVAHRTETE